MIDLDVGDEQDLAGLIEYNLRAVGFETDTANTGAGGIAKVRAQPPDLVLLDLMLPDIAGGEVLRMLKLDSELRKTAVIIVSAKGQDSGPVMSDEDEFAA